MLSNKTQRELVCHLQISNYFSPKLKDKQIKLIPISPVSSIVQNIMTSTYSKYQKHNWDALPPICSLIRYRFWSRGLFIITGDLISNGKFPLGIPNLYLGIIYLLDHWVSGSELRKPDPLVVYSQSWSAAPSLNLCAKLPALSTPTQSSHIPSPLSTAFFSCCILPFHQVSAHRH